MSAFEEIKKYIKEHYSKSKLGLYIEEKKTAREISLYQDLLSAYFDHTRRLTKEEIMKVNNLIKENFVLTDYEEINNYTTHMVMMLAMETGREHLKKQRELIIKNLDEGGFISKTDACLITKNLLIKRPEYSMISYGNKGEVKKSEVVKSKTYSIQLSDTQNNYTTTKRSSEFSTKEKKQADKLLKMFSTIKTLAFQREEEFIL